MELTLLDATFLARRKRFLADVRLGDGRVVVAHCPNSGSMRSLLDPGVPCRLAYRPSPTRSLDWTLTLLGLRAGGWAIVDTQLPNLVVAEAVRAGRIAELAGYAECRAEVAYGAERSRIDLLLRSPGRPDCYVEIKNLTMLSSEVAGRADFPDAVTERGAKHLRELAAMARAGHRAVQFYLVGRSDCRAASIAAGIDPAYAAEVLRAREAGVEILAYRALVEPGRIEAGEPCPFVAPLSPPPAGKASRRRGPRQRGGAAP